MGTGFRDTTVTLDTLAWLGETGSEYTQGIAGLANATAVNHDWLARQVVSLAGTGNTVPIDLLLDGQTGAVFGPSQFGYPGQGWGVAKGFSSDVLDTALALRTLQTVGLGLGLSVVNEQLATSAISAEHTFAVPVGSSDLFILVRFSSDAMRLNLTTPSNSGLFVDLSAITAPTMIGPLPIEAGTWVVTVENLSANPITYHYEAQFITAEGFDVIRNSTALSYIGLAQNTDGGWGITPEADSHLMTTAEVLMSLGSTNGVFAPRALLEQGVTWLGGKQNPNGGFGSEPGVSTEYETALAILAIASIIPDSPLLAPGVAFLEGKQLVDGSWNSDAYQTAIAVRALSILTTPLGILDIDGNGQGDALTDGLLLLRYLFGFRDAQLIAGAVAPDATRNVQEIEAHIAQAGNGFDIDGNGVTDALTDGLLTLRYLFGFRGAQLIAGAVAPDATTGTNKNPELLTIISSNTRNLTMGDKIMKRNLNMKKIFLIASIPLLAQFTNSAEAVFQNGDIFAGVGAGLIKRFSPDGTLLQTLDTTGGSSEQTGMCFDVDGNLYSTNFSSGTMSKFDIDGNLQESERL